MNTVEKIETIKQALDNYFTELRNKHLHINASNFVNIRNVHNSNTILSDGSQLCSFIYDLDLYNLDQNLEPNLYELIGKTDINYEIYIMLNKILNPETKPLDLNEFNDRVSISTAITNNHDITIVYTYTDLNIMFSLHYYEQ